MCARVCAHGTTRQPCSFLAKAHALTPTARDPALLGPASPDHCESRSSRPPQGWRPPALPRLSPDLSGSHSSALRDAAPPAHSAPTALAHSLAPGILVTGPTATPGPTSGKQGVGICERPCPSTQSAVRPFLTSPVNCFSGCDSSCHPPRELFAHPADSPTADTAVAPDVLLTACGLRGGSLRANLTLGRRAWRFCPAGKQHTRHWRL